MKKDFTAFNWGEHKVDFSKYKHIAEMKPVELHMRQDGSLLDDPSFAILMKHPVSPLVVYGEISLQMFNDGLADIGYEMKKI